MAHQARGGTRRRTGCVALASMAVALGGCGAARDEGFPTVAEAVQARVGARLHWDQGGGEDREAAQAVSQLLQAPLTPAAAIQVALLRNRSLQATYEAIGLAQADLVRAGLLRNPVFSADAKFARGGGVLIEMSLLGDFLDLVTIPLRRRLAHAALVQAQWQVTGAVIDLAGAVRRGVIRLQDADAQLASARALAASGEVASTFVARLRDAGNLPVLTQLQAQARSQELAIAAQEAQWHRTQAREALAELLGIAASGTWSVVAAPADLPPPALVEAVPLALTRNVDHRLLEARIVAAGRRLGVARPLALVPDAQLGLAGNRELDGRHDLGPALAVSIPLFDAGQADVATARAQLRRAQDEDLALLVAIQTRTRATVARLEGERATAQTLRSTLLPLRQAALAEVQRQVNGMLASPLALISAAQDVQRTQAAYEAARARAWLAAADLAQIHEGRLPPPPSADALPPDVGAPTADQGAMP